MTHPVGAFSSAARPAPASYAAGLRALPAGLALVIVHHRPHAWQWTWRSVGNDASRGDSCPTR